MTTNEQIVSDVNDAWTWIQNSLQTYLQSLILVATSLEAAEESKDIAAEIQSLHELTVSLGMDPIGYYQANLFFSQVASAEIFIQRCIKAVVLRYPQKLTSAQFKLSTILAAPSIDDLVEQAADEFLTKIMYQRPADYLSEFCSVLSIPEASIQTHWPAFVEIKARRDVGIHNNWVCSDTYLRKIAEVRLCANVEKGQSLIPVYRPYTSSAVESIHGLCTEIRNAVRAKYA